jgi:predicted dehydrogenase
MKQVRLGVIGLGGIAATHIGNVRSGKVPRCVISAVCDRNADSVARFASVPDIKTFTDSSALIKSGTVDAVLIATPHFSHTPLGIEALNQGLHVMVEKPVSVHKADGEKLLAAHKNPKQIFGAMFQMRTNPAFRKIREMIQGGELGAIQRVNWIITDWYRTEAYYTSGGWRATWAGEGGGVLLNQCPHNIDLFQWMFGMPESLRAFCQRGRYHNIEVEDNVTTYMEYANGATAVFIASTGEHPGTNRLEVTADRGRLVLEGKPPSLKFTRNEISLAEFTKTSPGRFEGPPTWDVEIPVSDSGGGHAEVLTNFVEAILDGKPLVAPAAEGLHSVELANAMVLSSELNQTLTLPIDGEEYQKFLERKIRESPVDLAERRKRAVKRTDDMASSFR